MSRAFKQILLHFIVGVLLYYPLTVFTREEKSMMLNEFQSNSEGKNYPLTRELGLTGVKPPRS